MHKRSNEFYSCHRNTTNKCDECIDVMWWMDVHCAHCTQHTTHKYKNNKNKTTTTKIPRTSISWWLHHIHTNGLGDDWCIWSDEWRNIHLDAVFFSRHGKYHRRNSLLYTFLPLKFSLGARLCKLEFYCPIFHMEINQPKWMRDVLLNPSLIPAIPYSSAFSVSHIRTSDSIYSSTFVNCSSLFVMPVFVGSICMRAHNAHDDTNKTWINQFPIQW